MTEEITEENIERVSFNMSRIYSIPNSIFTTFKNLRIFDGSETRLHELNSLSFNKAQSLNYIFLQKNRLTIIKDFVFVHCKKLKILDLSYNQISEIQESAFSSLLNLEQLNLSQNKIKSFHDETFKSLHALQWIWLNDNKIEFITSSMFSKENVNLRGIYLNANNELSAISPHAFDDLENLRYLFLIGCNCINENFKNFEVFTNVGIKFNLKKCHDNFKNLFPDDEKKFDINYQENLINLISNDCMNFYEAKREELLFLDEELKKLNLTLNEV
ncbi:hypothetical protein PVAND_002213 [Polypedilum vanderplanki]|uniref:Uncharacterized protein n=1 Tax=Polypedilum vanderplanki TaxID=319348 RepID=A0A9J6BRI5_POLVA|nr:hypothetical protein PVAND_002213 [Polypedilum vanderplanki]